jgi:hypothetical protein
MRLGPRWRDSRRPNCESCENPASRRCSATTWTHPSTFSRAPSISPTAPRNIISFSKKAQRLKYFFFCRNPRILCNIVPGIDLNAWRDAGAQGRALNAGPPPPPNSCQVGGRLLRRGAQVLTSPCTSCQCSQTGVSADLKDKSGHSGVCGLVTWSHTPRATLENCWLWQFEIYIRRN